MSTNDQTRNSPQRHRVPKPPRTRPMHRRIALILVLPLVSLVALWGFAASMTLGDARANYKYSTVHKKSSRATAAIFLTIPFERSAAAAVLATGGRRGKPEYAGVQAKMDEAIAAYRKEALTKEVLDSVTPAARQRMQGLVNDFDRLGELRGQVDAGSITPLQAIQAYSEIFDNIFNALMSNLATSDDLVLYQWSLAFLNANWARDFLMREDALMTAVLAAGGTMTPEQHTAFVEWSANRKQVMNAALANLTGQVRASLDAIVKNPVYGGFEQLEGAIVKSRAAADSAQVKSGWTAAAGPLSQLWMKQSLDGGELIQAKSDEVGDAITLRLVLAGGLGLLAVAASILLSLFFVRGVSRELVRLQRAAQHLAHERLPSIVARLRRGDDVNVAAEATQLQPGRTREIAAVTEAFVTVQNTAVETAVGEAELRKGISRVFMNLAWRSQSLLHRQLKMLDAMERRANDPDELEDLFRLDHLTTRMRRHAEGLVILSGSPAARGWNEPVSVEDLLRAAISEVEDYTRVDVMTSSTASVTGAVVADLVHLLAELIENATVFSPPNTEVLVRGEIVGNGLAIEIVDRGIGMGHEELAAINHRLAEPPEFDLADSDRLGLFVVARLAARHGVKVVLQPSAYGGTTAVVLVPTHLVILEGQLDSGERHGVPQLTAPAASSGAGPGRPGGQGGPGGHGDARGPMGPDGPSGPGSAQPGMPRRLSSARAMREPFEAFEPVRHESGRFTGMAPPAGKHYGETAEEAFQPVADSGSYRRTGASAMAAGSRHDGGGGGADPGYDEDSEMTGRLPRRVRQQHLAPQLRERHAEPQPAAAPTAAADRGFDDEDDSERPEFSRNLMSSLQAGWTLGRDADEDAEQHGITLFDHNHDTRWNDRGES